MSRAKIIIAEEDINYVVAFQAKFVDYFYDKVNLEIITDKDYYDMFFSTPQKVDVLIVSEDLYDSSLQRQNIEHLFVLAESNEGIEESNSFITRIYKYSSVKEILGTIVGDCTDVFQFESGVGDNAQIILVTSASGGSGKTTVSMGLAGSLAEKNKVLYINTDKLHTFQYLLYNKDAILSNEIYSKLMNDNSNAYNIVKNTIRNEVFHYLPPFKASLLSLGIKSDIFEKIVQASKASKEYDYIIVDTDNVFDEMKAKLIDIADKVMIVTNQTKVSVNATNEFVKNINDFNLEKYKFVCNDYEVDRENDKLKSKVKQKYIVDENIEHIENYDQLEIKDIVNLNCFQKAKYLVM